MDDHRSALHDLDSPSLAVRLKAARLLSSVAAWDDRDALQRARQRETVPWVRAAIDKALARAIVREEPVADEITLPVNDSSESDVMVDEIYLAAAQEVSERFTHELRKIIGRARLHARSEISEFEQSRTAHELGRLIDFVKGIEALGVASASPTLAEVDLAEVIAEEIDAACDDGLSSGTAASPKPDLTRVPGGSVERAVRVERHGPTPLLVIVDAGLLRLAIANGLRNAIEASMGAGAASVVVTWDETDRDIWIAIIDRGAGIAPGSDQIFEIGTTTKRGHSGMGLATARQAVKSQGGILTLDTRDDGTTQFLLRVPRGRGTK